MDFVSLPPNLPNPVSLENIPHAQNLSTIPKNPIIMVFQISTILNV